MFISDMARQLMSNLSQSGPPPVMSKRPQRSVPDLPTLRTIQNFDRDKLVIVEDIGDGVSASYRRVDDGSQSGEDDGDYEIIGNDGMTFWRRQNV